MAPCALGGVPFLLLLFASRAKIFGTSCLVAFPASAEHASGNDRQRSTLVPASGIPPSDAVRII